MNRTHACFFAGLALLGQATFAADQIAFVYEPETNDNTPTKLATTCSVMIGDIKDERNNKESIGLEFRPLLTDSPVPWLAKALQNLSAYGFKITDQAGPDTIGISPTLTRAYTYHGPMRINGVVAVDMQLTLPSGEKVSRKLRASGNKANMAGSNSEYMTALNYTVNNLIDRLANDLSPLCQARNSTLAASTQ